jgi:hypothetical protein
MWEVGDCANIIAYSVHDSLILIDLILCL